jgi:hypothetical protein
MNYLQHPITPPPELVEQLRKSADTWLGHITIAYQAGADQELEACVKWIEDSEYHPSVPEDLLAARRPKPPTLKEQALEALDYLPSPVGKVSAARHSLIRRALEALPND